MHKSRFLSFAACAAICGLASAQTFEPQFPPFGLPSIPTSTVQFGSGQVVDDFDGDGDMDIIVAPRPGGSFFMFRNDGNMFFTDVSAASGLGTHGSAHCMYAADIDNDGDKDVYVGSEYEPAKLFINDGTGVFVDEAVARGIVHSDDNYAATFGDYDRDGWLDLYLGNRLNALGNPQTPNRLYRNTGNGYFVDVTASAGVAGSRPTLVSVFFDYNEDLWPDILEVNDKGQSFGPNELYRNNGDGTFTPVAAQVGADIRIDGMGMDFLDVFHDGGVDFFCTDLPQDHLFQVWDPVAGSYIDATAMFGLQGGFTGWACHFIDYDNDRWSDLHVVHNSAPNMLFRNPAAPFAAAQAWPDLGASVGLNMPFPQYVATAGDFDDDGRMDVLNRYHAFPFPAPFGVQLFRNKGNAGNWIKFRTVGRVSNRDGLGARIEVEVGGDVQRQWVRSGTGYKSGSDPRVHFGLAQSPVADRVTITWPSGQVQHLTNVAANQIVDVVEPQLTAGGSVAVGGSTPITLSVPGDEGLPYFMLLSFFANQGTPLPDGNVLPIDADSLTALTLDPANPILVGSVGTLDAGGEATATLNIPPLPFLSGFFVHAAGLTTDAPAFPVARTVIVDAVRIDIL